MTQGISELCSNEERDFFRTYKRLPVVIDRGEGCYLFTDKGEKILDMFGGLAVNVLGYNFPNINEAIKSQLKKYIHISNYFYQEKQIELAERILKLSGFSKLFFSNSGTESTEAAIKLIRKFFLGTNKKWLISFSGSFHGRTMGALSLTARRKYRDQFAPLLPHIRHLEFNSLSELEKNVNDSTAGVFIECIQGEGGVNPVSQEFIDKLNELKKKFGFIIAADEIQTGVGRTGKLHSFEHYRLDADIVILAKGIGGGFPLGAILGSQRVENVFTPGEHGSTFGGNPVAAACGIVIFGMLEAGLMDKVNELGKYLVSKAESLKRDYSQVIKEVRGKGLMVGIELIAPGEFAVNAMMDRGVLINCTNENVIRLLPPYVITKKDIDYFIVRFEDVIKSVK